MLPCNLCDLGGLCLSFAHFFLVKLLAEFPPELLQTPGGQFELWVSGCEETHKSHRHTTLTLHEPALCDVCVPRGQCIHSYINGDEARGDILYSFCVCRAENR